MIDNRARYEAAVIDRLKESGFLEVEIRTECLIRCDDGYADEVINAGWHYWNAARQTTPPPQSREGGLSLTENEVKAILYSQPNDLKLQTIGKMAKWLEEKPFDSAPATYQSRVAAAHHALFHDDPTDIAERVARHQEESNELSQALGMTKKEAHALVEYTWDRAKEIDPAKEAGASMLTLASLCVVAGIDLQAAAEADLEKLQRPETIARIRAKRATRHGRGPLPGFDPAATEAGK